MVKSAVQGIAIFVIMQFVMGQFKGNGNSAGTTAPGNTSPIPEFEARPNSLDEGAVYDPIPHRIAPVWPTDSALDIQIVVSPSFASESLAVVPAKRKVVNEVAFRFGDYKDNRVIDTTIEVPTEVQNNGTLWGHIYVGLTGSNLDPTTKGYDSSRAYHFARPLTQHLEQKKLVKLKNLLAHEEVVRIILPRSSIVLTPNSWMRYQKVPILSSPTITILI